MYLFYILLLLFRSAVLILSHVDQFFGWLYGLVGYFDCCAVGSVILIIVHEGVKIFFFFLVAVGIDRLF